MTNITINMHSSFAQLPNIIDHDHRHVSFGVQLSYPPRLPLFFFFFASTSAVVSFINIILSPWSHCCCILSIKCLKTIFLHVLIESHVLLQYFFLIKTHTFVWHSAKKNGNDGFDMLNIVTAD